MTRRALITGAGRRVGRAIAVELARKGFQVAIHYRSSEAGARQTLADCEAAGGSGFLVQADLASADDVERLIGQVREQWDTLHVLVHNASAFSPLPFEEITAKDWADMQMVHVQAPFRITQALLPLLRAADPIAEGAAEGEGGLVVCMTDIGASRPLPGFAHYTVSKGGLWTLMRSISVELAPAVRAVAVSPGQVIWPEDYTAEQRAELKARIPMGRVGTPEDVARLVGFVALQAPYLNGITIDVDGGLAARY